MKYNVVKYIEEKTYYLMDMPHVQWTENNVDAKMYQTKSSAKKKASKVFASIKECTI